MNDTTPTYQAMLQQLTRAFTTIPFNQTLGLQLDQIEEDRVSMRFRMKEALIGNFLQGILHGGVISSVLDMAGGMIVMTTALYKNQQKTADELAAILSKCSTVDLQISYLRPGKGEIFTATAYLIKAGKKLSFTRMELHNEAGILIATANGTYLLK